MDTDEKLVMTCEICESEMIALHGFFITCPNCSEQNESCQAHEKINEDQNASY